MRHLSLTSSFQRQTSDMSIKSDLTRLVSQAFREAAKTPSLASARVDSIDSTVISINTKWSVSNLATNTKVNSNQPCLHNRLYY